MVIEASLLEFSKCMIKYCKNLMTRLQSNKYMTELSLCTDTGRKWNKKATIPYRMKDINCLCLLHILEENMLLPNLPLLETGWNSCFVEDGFCLNNVIQSFGVFWINARLCLRNLKYRFEMKEKPTNEFN